MPSIEKPSADSANVRRLTREGLLASRYQNGSEEERRGLRSGAVEIVAPLLFGRVTRPLEQRRGHRRCATGLRQLAPDCLDRFYLDLDAVLDDLFSHADLPIDNLEGWLIMRMPRAIVDAYRRRRGARGAAQRPRVPAWLEAELAHDDWPVELARMIMEWVGTDASAGRALWPLTAWVDRRSILTGDYSSDQAAVAKDVETVLAAMRRRPNWYQRTIERPLGHKAAPAWFPVRTGTGATAEPEPLDLNPRHERDEALLQELAAVAIKLITRRIDRGEDPAAVVPEVLGSVFGALPASYGLDRSPDATDGDLGPEQVPILITDPARLARIIATVLDLLQDRDGDAPDPDRPSEGDGGETGGGTTP